MNPTQGTVNSKIKINTATDNDSADIVFLGESPGFKNFPIDPSPVNSKNVNAGLQILNSLHVTPTKQISPGHYNNTPPKAFSSPPRLASPKQVNNLCNGSPNYRPPGPMSPTNSGIHPARQNTTVCRYQITNSPSYKITNRGTKKQTHNDQPNGTASIDSPPSAALGAEKLWDKMVEENKQKASSNPDIKNSALSDSDNLIVIDPETAPITKNVSHPTTNSIIESKSNSEDKGDNKKLKEAEENMATEEPMIKEKDKVEIERPSSRDSLESNGSQTKKKKRGRPRKQPPEIYIENLETGEGRDIELPVSDISASQAMFPVCDDKTDKDYVPASELKKTSRSSSRRNSQVKQSDLQKGETDICDVDVRGKGESNENEITNRVDRKRRLLCEGDKSEMSAASEVSDKDKQNSLTSSVENDLHKGADDEQLKTLSASVRNARMSAKRARYAKIMSQAKEKTPEKEMNDKRTIDKSNNNLHNGDELLENESKPSQDIEAGNERHKRIGDSENVRAHQENSRLSASLETENSQSNPAKNMYEKKSRPNKQKRKGVVKNIGTVISGLFGENFMSMADASGFVVNVRLDVQKKTSEAENQNRSHKVFKEGKDSSCLSANMFKTDSSSSDPQEGCSHSISRKTRIDQIDPKTLSNTELCAILKKRILDHPAIDNEMKSAVMDSIQYAKRLLDS